jgi:small subunit ribosomal protein S17
MPRRIITGKVVSDKMDKTVVVAVESTKTHDRYKKKIKQTTKFKAHDEENTAKAGDTVRIEESRPLSRDKRWSLLEVVERGQ